MLKTHIILRDLDKLNKEISTSLSATQYRSSDTKRIIHLEDGMINMDEKFENQIKYHALELH